MALYQCTSSKVPQAGHTMVPSLLIFSAGLLGNLIALFILWLHKLRFKNRGSSVFYVLVTALTITDLLGKCLVSPMVLVSYAKNQTMLELTDNRRLCDLFAFFMLFFGLSSMLILLAMALECWLSLGHPYLYGRLVTKRLGLLTAPAVYVFSCLFCGMPFLGFGTYVQYCPGTWCFIRMTEPSARVLGFSLMYGTVMGLLVLVVVLCNVSVMKHLLRMYQRQNRMNSIKHVKATEKSSRLTDVKAIDHFILLALMTTLFAICSLPLIVRTYVGAFAANFDEDADLLAMRFLSLNSVVDPWVFIIFRTSVFRTCIHALCRAPQHKNLVQAELLSEEGAGPDPASKAFTQRPLPL
ncbi:prostaglandin D2 receptor [Microcaecilia unicolor]|uniref:Prostaglandin D2 receptor-like n=1 Tax=Microcaecilia unicolor TaxID=1415580 RepID=A0A6P7YZZ5_9AMPH|nr:prostaglandin D2 receptor-like [Microcaecilia unicolor]